jgi:hypothetical protein
MRLKIRDISKRIPPIENIRFWLLTIVLYKLLLFVIMTIGIHENRVEVQGLFAIEGDTFGYFEPIRNWVDDLGYGPPCRMPGILPIFAPLYALFGNIWAQNIFIIFQFICSCISIYLLALISSFYMPKVNPIIVLVLFLVGPFFNLYDHYGLSDSLSISFIIFGIYFFTKFISETISSRKYKYLLIAAIFLVWSFFIRQIGLLVFGAFGLFFLLHLMQTKKIKYLKYGLTYTLVAVVAVSIWWGRNTKSGYPETILVNPIDECFNGYPKYQNILRELPIAWGSRFTLWGGEAEWFLRKNMKEEDFPFSNRIFTTAYNYDSLLYLRQASLKLFYEKDILVHKEQKMLEKYIVQTTNKYLKSYKEEKPFDYYFVNKLILLKKFIFTRGVALPFPAVSEMNLLEKVYKIFAIFFTVFIILTGLLSSILFIDRKTLYLNILIWLFIFIIGIYFGWIEFRYWSTIYPILVLFSAKIVSYTYHNYCTYIKGK